MNLTWIDADGDEWELAEDNGVELLVGTFGLDAPPVTLTLDDRVSTDGAALAHRRHPAKTFTLVLDVFDDSPNARARTLVGSMARRFRGPGTLRYTDDVNIRELREVYYESGLEGEELEVPSWRRVAVTLVALDPWWYGPVEIETIELNVTPTPFNDATVAFNAAIPFNGGSSVALDIEGDASAFPVFAVTGGFDRLSVDNGTLSWVWDWPLTAGQTGQVDTRPGRRGPRFGSTFLPGAPLQDVNWQLLAEQSRLFTLTPGVQSLVFSTINVDASATLTVAWEPRFLTP